MAAYQVKAWQYQMEPTGNEENREAQVGDMLLYISTYSKSECNSQNNSIEGLDNELDSDILSPQESHCAYRCKPDSKCTFENRID